MDGLIHDGDLAIRLMRDDETDYATMARWLTDSQVLEYYEGRDNACPIERVRTEYSPRLMAADGVVSCLLTHQSAPIGYLQFYPINEDRRVEYDLPPDASIDGLYGIDMFIGEPGLWNRGLGTRAVSLLLHHLFKVMGARKVILDPNIDNGRAIRCYEKCGFRKTKRLPHHEVHEGVLGDCWLMEVTPD